MINRENEVFTRIRNAILNKFPSAVVDSSYQAVPSGFPHVSFYMSDTYTPQSALSSELYPSHMAMTFDANVYSNLTSGRKQEAKEIIPQAWKLSQISQEPIALLFDISYWQKGEDR